MTHILGTAHNFVLEKPATFRILGLSTFSGGKLTKKIYVW